MYIPLHKDTQELYKISTIQLLKNSEKKNFLTQKEYEINIAFFSTLMRLTDKLDNQLKELDNQLKELDKTKSELNKTKTDLLKIKELNKQK